MDTPVVSPAAVDPNWMVEFNQLGFACSNQDEMAAKLQKISSRYRRQLNELADRCSNRVLLAHSRALISRTLVLAWDRPDNEFGEKKGAAVRID